MNRWRKTIKIKQFLSEDEDAETIKAAAGNIIAALPEDAPVRRLAKARDMADADEETALLVFNRGLSDIYDWADAERIWLG